MADSSPFPSGYAGKFLRVNLTTGVLTEERWDAAALRKWVGGNGVGAKILYDEVPPSVAWDDPENRLIVATGPIAGTSIMGSGATAFVSKGPMTNGATTTQANGFLGAFMKFAGYDGVIFQGQSPKWVYLRMHDGAAELRDAEPLLGLDTYDVHDRIAEELGKKEKQISCFSVGPAGEKLVRFAAIAGDRGHVAGHNGIGAVMGAKRLKAIVAERGKKFPVADEKALKERANLIIEDVLAHPVSRNAYEWGTQNGIIGAEKGGWLPVRNYTTSLFPQAQSFARTEYMKEWELEPLPCWACRTKHLHMVTIKGGKYDGFKTEEPEYEQWAAWGPQVGNTDVAAAAVLSNDVDRLGHGHQRGRLGDGLGHRVLRAGNHHQGRHRRAGDDLGQRGRHPRDDAKDRLQGGLWRPAGGGRQGGIGRSSDAAARSSPSTTPGTTPRGATTTAPAGSRWSIPACPTRAPSGSDPPGGPRSKGPRPIPISTTPRTSASSWASTTGA